MATIDLWRWWIADPASGKRYQTSYRMTEADARREYPDAQKVEGSHERRWIADDPAANSTSAWQSRRGEPLPVEVPPKGDGACCSDRR